MKIIQEIHKVFNNEDGKKERHVAVLSHEDTFIVVKVDNTTGWESETSNVRAYSFNDEKKAQAWVDKLCRDKYL